MPGRDLPQGGWVLPGAFVGRKYPVEVLGATAELVSRNALSRGIGRIYFIIVCTWIIHTILTYLKMLMAVRV